MAAGKYVEQVVWLLKNGKFDVRLAACECLSKLGASVAGKYASDVAEFLDDERQWAHIRFAAGWCLCKMGMEVAGVHASKVEQALTAASRRVLDYVGVTEAEVDE